MSDGDTVSPLLRGGKWRHGRRPISVRFCGQQTGIQPPRISSTTSRSYHKDIVRMCRRGGPGIPDRYRAVFKEQAFVVQLPNGDSARHHDSSNPGQHPTTIQAERIDPVWQSSRGILHRLLRGMKVHLLDVCLRAAAIVQIAFHAGVLHRLLACCLAWQAT